MQLGRDRTAFDNLLDQFGLDVSGVPDAHLIHDGFKRLCAGREMSIEAETAILYRVVAMQFAAMMKVMAKSGREPSVEDLSNVTALLDASVDWSEAAHDHVRLESIASNLNRSLEAVLSQLGVRRSGPRETGHQEPKSGATGRSSEEIKREVLRCCRVAAREKVRFRLSQLSGFFDKLNNESKLRRWGVDLERHYEAQISNWPQFWSLREPDEYRNMASLWQNFGLGDAHSEEAIYDDKVSLEVLMTWIVSLYPHAKVSSAELYDRFRRLQVRNTQALEGAYARGHRIVMPLPIDQLVREISQELGPYG